MFTFNRGTWEDGNPMPESQDDEHFDDYLRRTGYGHPRTLFGNEHGGHIEIYESSKDNSFFASVCPAGSVCYEVYLPDFPSFMIFVRDYATAFATEATNVSQQQTLDLLEKLFRVQHGHSPYAICQQCDPDAWAEREQRKKTQ